MRARKIQLVASSIVVALALAGCHHSQPVAKVPTTPPAVAAPAAPVANITATPETVDQGQPVELSWNTRNASTVTIEGLGTVAASGSKQVTPSASTTYHLVAKGDGGSADANARVTVNAATKVSEISDEQLFAQNVRDVFFSYDDYKVQSEQQAVLNADAEFLAKHPDMKLTIEGHCDERGSGDYNMALGENRASTVKEILAQHGVSADRVHVISLGKERPFCTTAENEACWQQNRRAHFVLQKKEVASN